MPSPLKVLFVSSEVAPFAKTGGLADVSGALPKALCRLGCDARVILPFYKCVNAGGFNLKKIKSQVSHDSLGNLQKFDIYETKDAGLTAYFIRNDDYFDRDQLYGTPEGDYKDNAYRFGFFSKAVLAAIKEIDFKCDIINCNDWQSALIPFYLKFKLAKEDFFKGIKTLFTIHNLAYQGQFSKDAMKDLAIPASFFNMQDLEFYGKINFMKSGILYSDAVNTVSKGYAEEILTVEYGCGLEGVLNVVKDRLFGITNGADYSEWSPEVDPHIAEKYNFNTLEKKALCKRDLLKTLGMKLSEDRPLLGSITRLAEQKGIDLLAHVMKKLVAMDVGVIVLGKGDEKYQDIFSRLASDYPEHLSVNIKFDNVLAHKIEAGSDMFLMPSRYEPCGLNQMYSLKYGTIPVVRATGGLDDIIIDIDEDTVHGNGFKFGPATGEAFSNAIEMAVNKFENKEEWKAMQKKVMQLDFSWHHSAREYIEVYKKIIDSGRV